MATLFILRSENMAVPTPINGAAIKAAFKAEAEKNKYMHNPSANPVPAPKPTPVPTPSPTPTPVVPKTSVPTPSFNPSYGANIEGFDPNNAQHKQLADAGQQWADAKRRGDQAGMDAAKTLGDQLRAGMGGSSYNAKTGVTNVPTPPMVIEQPKLTGGTAPETPYMQLTPAQINQEAGYQIGKERADLKNTVDNMIAGVKNNANYANQQIMDNRTLEDAKIERSLNPFSGRTPYDKSMIGRGRAIDDTYRATNLENELTRIQNDLYNFDKLAPDKQRTLINEMTRIERDYGLQVGQLTGNFNGQRTLAGQQFDWSKDPSNPANVGANISNKIAQIQLDNLPAQTKLELQQLEARAKQGDIDLKTAEWQLNELTNPQSVTNKSKALQLQMQELEAKNLPEMQRLELQKIKKQIAEIGKEPTKTPEEQRLKEIAVQKAEIELAALQSGGNKDYSSVIKSIENMYVSQDPYTKETKISNTTAMRNAIIALNMSDEETDRYLTIYGLPTN